MSDNIGNTKKIHYLSGGAILINTNGVETLYYGYNDYQGSLIALANDTGTVVERYAYDPWGKRRNPADWTVDDSRTSWIVIRGYTMHEHLDAFNIINMNGRVYDPLTAMFFSPDPFVQAPGNWLNYNRYGYAFGNPFKYTDPDGEWLHLVAGAVIGGVINWVSNGAEFSWEGLSYFGAGAVSGLVTAAAPGAYVFVNAGLSAVNNFVQQSFDPDIGIDNINYKQVAFQGIMGGVTSFAGGEFGKALQVDKWVSGIGSPLLRFMSQNIISNTVVGGTLGGFSSIANGGDFFEGAWGGVKQGLVTGTISGIAGSVQYAHDNKVNLLTGKSVKSNLNLQTGRTLVDQSSVAEEITSAWPAASNGRTVINGIEYTTHALERMQPVGTIMDGATSYSRGIPPSVVENAVKFGVVTPGNTSTVVVRTFDNIRVVTNPAGTRVITVIKIGK